VSKEGFVFRISVQSSGASITSYENTDRRLERIAKAEIVILITSAINPCPSRQSGGYARYTYANPNLKSENANT